MKIEEIEKGATVWMLAIDKNFTVNHRQRGLPQPGTVYKYFILDVHKDKRIVIASCNGAPAQAYKMVFYRKWVKEKPKPPETNIRYRI